VAEIPNTHELVLCLDWRSLTLSTREGGTMTGDLATAIPASTTFDLPGYTVEGTLDR
jgi:hypothetical protein